MQVRKSVTWIIAAAIALAVVLSFLVGRSAPKSPVAIGVIRYDDWHNGPLLAARVGMTNTGRITIRYKPFHQDTVLRTESRAGWTSRENEAWAKLPIFWLSHAVLLPGSNSLHTFALPLDTLRWQVSFKFTTPSSKERVMSKLPKTWQRRLEPILRRFLSNKEGTQQEILSDVFEIPYVLRNLDKVEPPIVLAPDPLGHAPPTESQSTQAW